MRAAPGHRPGPDARGIGGKDRGHAAELEAIDSAHADHSQELERALNETRRCQEAAPPMQRCASSVSCGSGRRGASRAVS